MRLRLYGVNSSQREMNHDNGIDKKRRGKADAFSRILYKECLYER